MGERVMVFAPAPLLTVTIEHQAGAEELHLHPGGQGIWQARMLSSLGASVVLCVTVAGEVGAVLAKLLDDEDVTLRAVPRSGGNGWYVHDRRDKTRNVIAEDAGTPLLRHYLDDLYTIALAEGLRAPVSVLSGPAHPSVVEPAMYRRMATDLAADGGRVVADLADEHLSAVLEGGPAVVKVSHDELVNVGRARDDSVPQLLAAARRLRADGAGAVLLSRAAQPSIVLYGDREVEVHVPRLEVVDARGAGDSMTAGVAAVLARDGTMEEAICTGAAAGALNVTRHGLGTGRPEAVAELMGRVRLEPLKG